METENKELLTELQKETDTRQAELYHKSVKSTNMVKFFTGVLMALIIGCALVACCIVGVKGFIKYKFTAYEKAKTITIKGYASQDITSDLISWSGHFELNNHDYTQGFNEMAKNKETIRTYLVNQGVNPDEIVFSSVSVNEKNDYGYNEKNEWVLKDTYYLLGETVSITSSDVDLITAVSRSSTDLMREGIYFESYKPEYQYTKLDELKLSLIGDASEDALNRAGIIINGAGGTLGELTKAKLANISVTPLYEDADSLENWGYYGKVAKSLASKEKTVTVSVSCTYEIVND